MKKTSTKIIQKTLLIGALFLALSGTSKAQAFFEGFDDITTLAGSGWYMVNLSSPAGTEDWVQGYSPGANQTYNFPAYSGGATSFICGSFLNTSGTGTISNWLLTPEVSIGNGDTISFWTRSTALGTTVYPDRMQVLMSSVSGTNVGSTATDVGDFTTTLTDINPTYTTTDYPLTWTQYSLEVTGLSANVTGRFAFRYFVEDAGPTGNNSFIIGIDDVEYKPFSTGTGSLTKNVMNLHIYPNPTTSYVTFDMNAPVQSDAKVSIVNAMGQVVGNGSMYHGTKMQVLDVSHFANGMYTVIVTDNDHNVFRSSFLKN